MVIRYTIGSDMKGALHYNLQKVREHQAKIIELRNIPGHLNEGNQDKLAAYFNMFTKRNMQAKKNVLHFSINFNPEDKVTESQISRLAEGLTEKINMRGQPALVVQHFDAAHPHFHLVTTNINEHGKRISDSFIAYPLREYCEEQEIKHDWVRTGKNRTNEMSWNLRRIEKTRIDYPEENLARKISAIVDSTSRYKFTSLEQYNALLNHYNIKAIEINHGKKKGIMFSALKNGRPVGTPIRSKDLLYSKGFYSRVHRQMESQGNVNKKELNNVNPFREESRHSTFKLLGKSSTSAYLLDDQLKEIREVPSVWLPDPGSPSYPPKFSLPGSVDYGSQEENRLKEKKKRKLKNNHKL